MNCRHHIASIAFCIGLFDSPLVHAQNLAVDQAVAFLKTACVSGGTSTSLDVVSTRDGIQLKEGGSGGKTIISIVQKELQGLVDSSSAESGKQAREVRECMKPYIEKILGFMLSGGVDGNSKTQTIETGGFVFVTSDFDKTLLAMSESQNSWLWHGNITRIAGLHPVKVMHYLGIALNNKMVSTSDHLVSCPCYMLTPKGNAYLLKRNLIN